MSNIKITDEMIAAGQAMLSSLPPSEFDSGYVAQRVYEAMEEARHQGYREAASRVIDRHIDVLKALKDR